MVEEIDGVMGKEEIENATDEEKETENVDELASIPIQPYDHKAQTGAIFILEKASLEVAKLGKFYQLLSSDHDKFLRSNNKNPADYRSDIAHQITSIVCENGERCVLFEIKPYVRIPRTYKRFSGIMSLLLQKLSITVVGESEKLLRVIKNPVTQYLPLNSRKIGFSYISEKLVDIRDYVAAVSDDVNFVFVTFLFSSNFLRSSGSTRQPAVSTSRDQMIVRSEIDSSRARNTDASPGALRKMSSSAAAQRSSLVLSADHKCVASSRNSSNIKNLESTLKGIEGLHFNSDERQHY
ncbi:Ribosomal RNA small subunit methyltransferase NEP1 [Camellia lanceoleosa]|nr:Ribosomal RNA small subunit methyltransferase NEP1 [Camellia lanceoleosa]